MRARSARIADAALRHKFEGRIVAGHCCSLALADDDERAATIAKVAEAGIAVVSLPMCNMYLQDREAGRTPRWRGVAPLHELAAAGVTVMVASDNTRDPFYAYGDLDMMEVYREATRILHFDHSDAAVAEDDRGDAGRGDAAAERPHGGGRAGGPRADARAHGERAAVAAADGSRRAVCGEAGRPYAAGLPRAGLKEPVFFHRRFSLSVDKLRMI